MKRLKFHLIFWGVFFIWASFITHWTHIIIESEDTIIDSVIYAIHRIPLIVIPTYLLIYIILPQFIFRKRNYLLFIIYVITLTIIFFILDRLLVSFTLPTQEFEFFNSTATVRNLYLLLTAMGLASITRLFRLYIGQEKQRYTLMEDNLKTQLNFLRGQMNPHFLFNALNTIYSMSIQKDQKEIASGIENLSGIMRYLTYESNSRFVPLKNEIKLIQDYVSIQYLRLANEDNLTLSFNLNGDIENKKIAPVILLPLVENAFKHGVVSGQNSYIMIDLYAKESQLTFIVENTTSDEELIENMGIGLKNISKRLNLIYPNNFRLDIKNDNSQFSVQLVINTES